MKRPFIVVFGHEKGGAGKSTLCLHTIIGLIFFNPNLKITVIDLDMTQGTTYYCLDKRKNSKYFNDSDNISFFGLYSSIHDSKENALKEDIVSLRSLISQNYETSDIIILDTPGSKSNFTSYSIFLANLLITPLNDSKVDIDVLVRLDNNGCLIKGPYFESVFNQRKNRISRGEESFFHWILLINRASVIASTSSNERENLIRQIAKNISAYYFGKIRDNTILREAFDKGYTIFDLLRMTNDCSSNKLAVYSDLTNLVQYIYKKYELFVQEVKNA